MTGDRHGDADLGFLDDAARHLAAERRERRRWEDVVAGEAARWCEVLVELARRRTQVTVGVAGPGVIQGVVQEAGCHVVEVSRPGAYALVASTAVTGVRAAGAVDVASLGSPGSDHTLLEALERYAVAGDDVTVWTVQPRPVTARLSALGEDFLGLRVGSDTHYLAAEAITLITWRGLTGTGRCPAG